MSIFQKFTLRSLRENKVRTIATIVGIVLSVSLFTAVTTGVSSLMDFMARVASELNGNWYVSASNVEESDVETVTKDSDVEKWGVLRNVGYAKLEKPWNENRPYLYVGAYEGSLTELCPVHLVQGRMPENSGEVVLPEELMDYGNTVYKVGDTLQLTLGTRLLQGHRVVRSQSYDTAGEEQWKQTGTGTYKVVGVYRSSIFTGSYLPGYTLLTKSDANVKADSADVFVTVKKPGKSQDFCDRISKQIVSEDAAFEVNSSYLSYSGLSMDDTLKKTLYGLMAILMGIIMFGSISLIYNSFSISINERKKQYGLLSSIGATKKQLRRSVVFESVVLSAIGIPLGVLLGIGGLSVTLYCLRDTFARFLGKDVGIPIKLTMSASLLSILLAAAVGFVTVLLSAWIPARRAMRASAIEVIRQADEVKVSPRSLRVSMVTRKLFGLSGTLGAKNFKRNKRRYRATVVSLFVSIVIFVSTSSFCDYMSRSLEDIITMYGCDLYYSTDQVKTLESRYETLSRARGVTKSGYYYVKYSVDDMMMLSRTQVTPEYLSRVEVDGEETGQPEGEQPFFDGDVEFLFVDDDNYRQYLKENHLDIDRFMNPEKPVAVAVDKVTEYDEMGNSYKVYRALEETPFRTKFLWQKGKNSEDISNEMMEEKAKKPREAWEMTGEKKVDDQGNILVQQQKYKFKYHNTKEDEGVEGLPIEGTERWVPLEEAYRMEEIEVGGTMEKGPYGTDSDTGSGIVLCYPVSAMEKILPGAPEWGYMAFDSSDPDETESAMFDYMQENGISTGDIRNIYAEVRSSTALMTVINVFSYGFIILISLIALTNVFNTISTNISVRRREFAMLRSVGMTNAGFNRMMCYECLLYGIKGIVFGLPAAILVTLLIYSTISGAVAQHFYVPWYSIAIAVGSVFLVVFATMMYAMRKVKRDNVVETLKQENF